ncbi:hypothetical protein [Brachybacterium timonense]|uniref:hypothetical protein n=1 Tax=Brachybacterium timonense TaxID=2050896 RepID=UPI001FEA9078|nr:hypothetical protein [Brachybacterium timonense]
MLPAHAGRHVLILVHDDHTVTSDATTGEIIAEHRIDPARDYQPKLPRTHNTPTQTPRPGQSVNPRKKS